MKAIPSDISPKSKIRNVAIIAHVDHGKTTLVDAFLKQTHIFRDNQEEMSQDRILDSNDLEREKGITISAKTVSIPYKDHTINIIDTPGHADFGGEVERTLNMADGCILVIDAQEGVMPQTKAVLRLAFELGLVPIVVINKIDKKLADVRRSVSKVQDLFLKLATDESQLEFETFYAIAREGKVWEALPPSVEEAINNPGTVEPLLDAVIRLIPEPSAEESGSFQMQVSLQDYDAHYGQYAIGRISRGMLSVGDRAIQVSPEGKTMANEIIKGLFVKKGLQYTEVETVSGGQIMAVAGFNEVSIGDTICAPDSIDPLPAIKISPPSLKIRFEANTSPLLGKEGTYPNWKQIQARLDQEARNNVGLRIENNDDGSYSVSGRGELHLAILIESMRREGYEFQVRKPEVIIKKSGNVELEPVDEIYIEVPEEHYGTISQEIYKRKGELIETESQDGTTKMTYKIFTRNLIGLRRILLFATKGELIFYSNFLEYAENTDPITEEPNGRLVSNANGTAIGYALNMIQERGKLLIEPGTTIYEGMIIGMNKYRNDMIVNPTKTREKGNVRMAHAEVTLIHLKPPVDLTLEYALGIIRDDEILEVTPKNIRLRKVFLNKAQEFEAHKKG